MTETMRKLCQIVGTNPEMLSYNRMTVDEILECIGCGVDDDGEIIELYTGKETGICYEDL